MIIRLCPTHIHLSPIHFRKTYMTPKNSGGFATSPLLLRWMMPCWRRSGVFISNFTILRDFMLSDSPAKQTFKSMPVENCYSIKLTFTKHINFSYQRKYGTW